MHWSKSFRYASLLVLAVLAGAPALAHQAGKAVVETGTVPDDFYAAGSQVRVLADVHGDVVVAGGRVVVDGQVSGDVLAAGGSVDVRGAIQDDVRAAGGDVSVDAAIAGDLVGAGGNVSVARSAKIAGRAWLAGGTVEVDGSVGKELRVAAGSVAISGEVAGPVHIRARDITLLPTARIHGDLVYHSPRPASIDPHVVITGKVTHVPGKAPGPKLTPARKGLVGGLVLLSLLLVGATIVLLFPDFSRTAARSIATDPWKSLGLGLAILVTVPFSALLLAVTVIGLPLGVAAMAVYFVSLLAAPLITAFLIGDIFTRAGLHGPRPAASRRLLGLAAALLVLGLAQLAPVLGPVVAFLALVLGLGAWTLAGYRTYVGARA
jgi:cytoskeletal protein CcmA (bactofilin family)